MYKVFAGSVENIGSEMNQQSITYYYLFPEGGNETLEY